MFSSITACQTAGAATRIVGDVLGLRGDLNKGIVEVGNAKTSCCIQLVPFACSSTVTDSLGVDVSVE